MQIKKEAGKNQPLKVSQDVYIDMAHAISKHKIYTQVLCQTKNRGWKQFLQIIEPLSLPKK